jgi:hypothetical protein
MTGSQIQTRQIRLHDVVVSVLGPWLPDIVGYH